MKRWGDRKQAAALLAGCAPLPLRRPLSSLPITMPYVCKAMCSLRCNAESPSKASPIKVVALMPMFACVHAERSPDGRQAAGRPRGACRRDLGTGVIIFFLLVVALEVR